MPGAWELQSNQEKVLVVILTREIVTSSWANGFRNLIIPGIPIFLSGMPFDMARNVGCQRLIESGCDWCFMYDDDVIAPPDAILRLLAHKRPIVSGLYYRRNKPIYPVMLRELPGGGTQWITEYKENSLMEVDYVGAGCLLIHKSVIQTVPYPQFEWLVDRYDLPEKERMSEDFAFCKKARKCGFNIFVDTSIKCRHAGLSEAKAPGELSPLEIP